MDEAAAPGIAWQEVIDMDMVSRRPEVNSVDDGDITRGWEAIRTDADQIVGREGSYRLSIGSIDVTTLGAAAAVAVAPYTKPLAQ